MAQTSEKSPDLFLYFFFHEIEYYILIQKLLASE